MKGSCHFDKRAKRWFIQIYWEGKKHRIWKHPVTGEPFWENKSADKQLSKIRSQVDEGQFNPDHWKENSPIFVNKYAENWLDSIDVAPKTLKDYRSSVFNYIIPFFQNKDIRTIRHSDLVKFFKSIKRVDKGKYNVMSVLKTMLRYAWRNEDILSVPPFPKLSYSLPEIEYLELEQQEAILSAIPSRHKPIFQFMMEYGVRPGEARALKKDCISDNEIVIKRAFSDSLLRETTKTKLIRKNRITTYFRTVLDSLKPNSSVFVFVREDGQPYTSKNLNRIWQEACSKAGIKIKMYNGVRHSLGCQLLDLGYDMDLVREQLGHTKSEMTQRYAKRSKRALADALEARRLRVVNLNQAEDKVGR